MNKVLIIGLNGQLGQHLAKYLLGKDLVVIGTIRHKSYDEQEYIFDRSKVKIELLDLSDAHSIDNLIIKYKPEYLINCGANAYVGDSWALPVQHLEINTIGVLHLLESIRKNSPHTRFFNLGTSEEFAVCEKGGPQNEETKIAPRSPYGCSKAAARYLVDVYRESYGLYALQGWTFNFESKLRGEKYLTRKVTKGVARIHHAEMNDKPFEPIELGNLDSSRSWQHASDVAAGIWLQLNQDKIRVNDWLIAGHKDPVEARKQHVKKLKNYVLSESDTHTVREFVKKAFETGGIYCEWTGEGIDEKLIDEYHATLVKVNPKHFRPLDVTFLYGDSCLARKELGWEPKVSFSQIIEEMVSWDIQNYKP